MNLMMTMLKNKKVVLKIMILMLVTNMDPIKKTISMKVVIKKILMTIKLEKLIKQTTPDLQQKVNIHFSSPLGVQTPIKSRYNRIVTSF